MTDSMEAIRARRSLQQEQPLPDHALQYFDHLYGMYQSLPADKIPSEYKDLIKVLIETREKKGPLTWHGLYTFDLVLTRFQPPERLSRIAQNLRSRYRDVAGLQEYDAYIASKPPELAPTEKIEDQIEKIKLLRADIEYLLGQTHLRYVMGPIRGSISHAVSKIIIWVPAGAIAFVLIYVFAMKWINYEDIWQKSILDMVINVGVLGGLVSVQQRFKSISRENNLIYNIFMFTNGWADILPSVVSGIIFAAVLYLVIASGLLSGELFPSMASSTSQNGHSSQNAEMGNLLSFLKNTVPKTDGDYAKLLVRSFIAGFAERFVPDTLSRFVNRNQTESGSKA